MSRNIRIRTEPNGGDNHIKIQLNQDFDFLEILSLNISQEDVYRSFYSNYGVVVGRVIMNSGVGVPNSRISIFIPLTDEDSENPEISTIYPYSDISVLNNDGVRYNTLPNDAQGVCHAPIGTFPTKRELVDNDPLFEVFEKYYKYTTTTNGSGDFMLFGVPVGNHTLNVDVDLSDMGIFSQRPYDFIEQGNPKKLFESPNKFKSGTNLNNLTQVRNRQVGINVIPFWGDKLDNEVGISRVDVDINYNIRPQAIFTGSIFGDNEKNGVNKNCRPRKKMGKVCEMGEGEGTIEMIRKNVLGETEKFDIEGGQLINSNGVWAYQIPMNLDYMVTDEFGVLTPSDDPNKGIPTRSRMRFKVSLNETGGDGRLRTKAKYLIPNNPNSLSEVDYSFGDSTPDIQFRDLYWNKIYTIKNHISRFQKDKKIENRNFIGFKDVDDCVGTKNPIPFNKLDTDFNVLYVILCSIIGIIIDIIKVINDVLTFKFPVGPFTVKPFKGFDCVGITCPLNDFRYVPGCGNGEGTSVSETKECFRVALAEALNVFEFDFYNEWLNGALYPFLLKYKRVKRGVEKFCGDDSDSNGLNENYIVNTNPINGNIDDDGLYNVINEGVVISYEDELFYKPLTEYGHKLYATDLYNLGAVFDCDWQSKAKIQKSLINTSYQLPPLVGESDVTGLIPLLFELSCTKVSVRPSQATNIRRICEIGVGLDEGESQNDFIDKNDIDNNLVRSQLIKLNSETYESESVDNIDSWFGSESDNIPNGSAYINYRKVKQVGKIEQFDNSFYFYFGTKPNNTALDLMNSKYFVNCDKLTENIIKITGVVTNITTVGGLNGAINITVNGGSPEYIYEWYNNDNPTTVINNSEDVNNLSSGSYYVVVTDSNGLIAKKTFIIRGLQSIESYITNRPTRSQGESTGVIYINSITGGIGPYDVNVTGPQSFNPLTINDVSYGTTINDLPFGNYTITITDSNNPLGQLVPSPIVEIGVPTPLSVSDTIKPPSCSNINNGEVVLTINGGTEDYSIIFNYVEDVPDIVSFTNTFIDGTAKYNGLKPGAYTYKVDDDYGQSWPLQNITVPQALQPILDRSNDVLIGSGVNIGEEYTLELNGTDITGTFIPLTNPWPISGTFPINNNGYQLISSFGCASNVID